MSKRHNKVADFGAHALALYKKRQSEGELDILNERSPLLKEAAKAGMPVLDADWLYRTLQSIPEPKRNVLGETMRMMAAMLPGGVSTPAQVLGLMYHFLRDAEASGHLHVLQQEPVGPNPGGKP